MAHRNIFITFILVIVFTASISAQTGFFIEGGVGGRYVIGSMSYTIPGSFGNINNIHTPPQFINTSVAENGGLGWSNNLILKYYGTIGFRISNSHSFNFKYSYYSKPSKNGIRNVYPYIYRPNTNNNPSGVVMGGDSYYNSTNNYKQHSFRLSWSNYFKSKLFFTMGFEYTLIDLGFKPSRFGDLIQELSGIAADGTFGFILGLGVEKPVSNNNMFLVGSLLYIHSVYYGDELLHNNLDLNISGIELEYSLRYYIK